MRSIEQESLYMAIKGWKSVLEDSKNRRLKVFLQEGSGSASLIPKTLQKDTKLKEFDYVLEVANGLIGSSTGNQLIENVEKIAESANIMKEVEEKFNEFKARVERSADNLEGAEDFTWKNGDIVFSCDVPAKVRKKTPASKADNEFTVVCFTQSHAIVLMVGETDTPYSLCRIVNKSKDLWEKINEMKGLYFEARKMYEEPGPDPANYDITYIARRGMGTHRNMLWLGWREGKGKVAIVKWYRVTKKSSAPWRKFAQEASKFFSKVGDN
ncbi:hypothetical protein M433DRAFT_530425 [Acidomyces richmondensis BFW]|nr:hypothetical protein M433DRAFT_530425 [Acidomyces richmondensis BFW]